jgi:hypothetical protein
VKLPGPSLPIAGAWSGRRPPPFAFQNHNTEGAATMSRMKTCSKGHRYYYQLDFACPTCRREREREQDRQAMEQESRKQVDDALKRAVYRL